MAVKKFHVDRDWFEKKYLVELLPTRVLAQEIGCCGNHVNKIARKFGIPVRPRQPRSIETDHLNLDIEWIKHLYLEQMMPCHSIAKLAGCEASAINRRLKKVGVKLRHHNDTKRGRPSKNRINIDPSLVAKLYAEKYASAQTVANQLGVGRSVIDRIIRENSIPKKPLSETRNWWGTNSPRWRHDLSDEERENRRDNAAQKRWREQIFARDGYKCKKCGDSKGGNLNAHHITPYCADKSCAWDLNNGVTLCATCHKGFHSTYGLKKCDAFDLIEFLNVAQWPAVVASVAKGMK